MSNYLINFNVMYNINILPCEYEILFISNEAQLILKNRHAKTHQ
jgi:hypothetical protein